MNGCFVPGGVEMDGEIIDVDAELGLGTPTGSVYEPEDGEEFDDDNG